MRERVELLVGRVTRAMWVMTFHAACARMLRSDADRLGYTRQFTIYDAADQRRLIKTCLDDLGYDTKRFTPRAMQSQISDAKNHLRSPEDYRRAGRLLFEQTVADVYEHYERELAPRQRDGLRRPAGSARSTCSSASRRSTTATRSAFRWVMVDEYQDTNHVQYRWLQLLTVRAPQPGRRRRRRAVPRRGHADHDGRRVDQADRGGPSGRRGPLVLRQRRLPARARDARRSSRSGRSASRSRRAAAAASSARRSTPTSRATTADYTPAAASDLPDVATRQGLPGRHHAHPPERPAPAGAAVCRSARRRSTPTRRGCSRSTRPRRKRAPPSSSTRCKYGIPTLPFVARPGGSVNGLVHDQALIDQRVRRRRHVRPRPAPACATTDLDFEAPHHVPLSFEGRRRNVTLTLCGDRRGRRPMHVVAIGGRDAEARERGSTLPGFACARPSSARASWRYESCFADFGRAVATVERDPRPRSPSRCAAARLGAARGDSKNTLAFIHAASVRPGHGDVHAPTASSTSSSPSSASRSRPGLRPQRRGHAQLRRRRARHPQLDLRLPRRRHQEHPRLPGRLPRRPRREVGAELPLDADDPRRRQRGDRQQPRADGQAPVDGRGGGRPGPGARDGGRARRGAVRDGRDRAARGRGRQPRRDRGLLPDQRAVAGAGGHAGAGAGSAYQIIGGTKFYERAEIKDAVSTCSSWSTRRTGRRSRGSRTRRGAGSGRRRCRACWRYANDDGHPGVGRGASGDVPGLAKAARKALDRFMEHDGAACASAWRAARRSRRSARRAAQRDRLPDALEAERTIEAQGRLENLEELVRVAREYDVNDAGAARSASSCSRSRCSRTRTRSATTRAS